MKTGLYYCDIIKEAKIPPELLDFVPEQVYEDEELERHASIARMFADIKKTKFLEDNNAVFERIKLLLKIAYENYTTYKNLYDQKGFSLSDFNSLSDIYKIPYITKEELMNVYQEAINNPFIQIHHESSTTGTNGNSLKLINDIDSHNRSFIHILQMYESMIGEKIDPTDWIYSIYDENQLLTSVLGEYRICTISVDAPLDKVANHIRMLRPKIVSGYASKILKLATYLPDAKEIGIKLFTTNSEYSSPYVRRSISEKLGIPILDEYSSEELLIMGWELGNGKYYVPQDFSYIEFIQEKQSEIFSVVGTNLWDLTMPRIRYKQGDLVEKVYFEKGKLYFENLMGKENCLIIKNKPVFPTKIIMICDKIVLQDGSITDYQIVQGKDDHLIFYYCVSETTQLENENRIVKKLKNELQSYLLNEHIDFFKVKRIDRNSNKKTYVIKGESKNV